MHTTHTTEVYQAGIDASAVRSDEPCKDTRVHETGFDSAESHLAVADDGTIFFAPAFTEHGATVLRSRDECASWEPCIIDTFEGRVHGRPQPNLFLDPITQRLFFYTAAFGVFPPRRGFHSSWSDDHGDTWHHGSLARAGVDWGKMFSARQAQSTNVAPVLYFSVPSPISTRFFPILFPRFQRILSSSDGGTTFEDCSRISIRARDHGLDRREWIIFGSGVVADDGTVFIGFRRGPSLAIAISRDQGSTWNLRDVPNSDLLIYRNILQVGLVNPNYVIGQPIELDSHGNLIALWPGADDRLRLAWSSDQGETWSTPVVVTSPGIKRVRYCAMASGPDGALAIAYYGTADGKTYHGYIAESLDPTAVYPVFTGGPVNDPDQPLYPNGWDTGYLDMFAGGDLNEVVQVRYSPTGAIFASFCRQERPGWPKRLRPRARLVGVVGELR